MTHKRIYAEAGWPPDKGEWRTEKKGIFTHEYRLVEPEPEPEPVVDSDWITVKDVSLKKDLITGVRVYDMRDNKRSVLVLEMRRGQREIIYNSKVACRAMLIGVRKELGIVIGPESEPVAEPRITNDDLERMADIINYLAK